MIDLAKLEWTVLGFVGAGLYLGVRLSRGEKVNAWAVATTLGAGAAVSGTSTEAIMNFANLPPFWAGPVALFSGLMAMGFVINAIDGKVPLINKFFGGKDGDAH